MRKLILFLVSVALAMPSTAFSIQEFKRTGEIKYDETGGYSETQRDHHKRRSKNIKAKTGEGYREGSYHSTGESYSPGEWQFIGNDGDNSGKKKSKKKKKSSD